MVSRYHFLVDLLGLKLNFPSDFLIAVGKFCIKKLNLENYKLGTMHNRIIYNKHIILFFVETIFVSSINVPSALFFTFRNGFSKRHT